VARRPTAGPGKPTRRLSADFAPSSAWPHIEEFVESGGNIQIGRIAPIECATVAADPHGMIAALVPWYAATANPSTTWSIASIMPLIWL